jgi:hypothetical protein
MSNAPSPVASDRSAILDTVDALFPPDAIVELRALFLKGKKRTDSGYFDGAHREALAEHAARLNTAGAAVYVPLNPINPQLLARYCNRMQDYADKTTSDAEVTARRWLLLDFDPARPAGTSATDAQLSEAREVSDACLAELQSRGWPAPSVAESGNGMHLLYPLDLPNDAESRDLVKGALSGLATRFDTRRITLDQSVFNAGRITKLYGTVANKGDPTPATPWRRSRLLSAPARESVVSVEQLREWVPVTSQPVPRAHTPGAGFTVARSTFDLDAFLSRLAIPFAHDAHEGADRYKLAHCPFNPEHGMGEAAIFRHADGGLGFKCQHNSCADRHWQDVRNLVDPGRTRVASATAAPEAPQGAQAGASDGESASNRPRASGGSGGASLILTSAADLTPEPVQWLWNGWLAEGKLHILAGAPGTGKTTAAIDLAATVSRGGRWPDGTRAEPGGVLIASYEDDPADTIVPRLLAAGADMSRVHILEGTWYGTERRSFSAKDDAALLAEAIKAHDVRLVIMDPIISALGSFDSHKNAETRQALQPLADVARESSVALLGIAHFSKGTVGRDPLERVSGSLAFGAVSRVVMATAKVISEDGTNQGIFVRVKSNIGPNSGGFAYDLEQVEAAPGIFASRTRWGEAVEGDARELLAEPEPDRDVDSMSDLEQFIRDELRDTPILANEFRKDAEGAGYQWRSVQRVAKRMGAESRKSDMRGPWKWGFYDAPKATIRHEEYEGDTTNCLSSSSSSASSLSPSAVDNPDAEAF